jgi:UDP-glucuronate decarboxylase
VDVKIVRIFNTYGPNIAPNDGRLVSNFICQALQGKDITIFGDGTQTRSLCYVDDLVKIIVRIMNGPQNFCGPVNIGNPSEITVNEFARKIMTKIPTRSKIIHLKLPEDDPIRRNPDISLVKKEFGWAPEITLDEGLDRTIEYFKGVIGV